MPTARPIIIEKFIDHTDIGVTHDEQVEQGEADGDAGERPAAAGCRRRAAAPKAMNSMMMVGRPLTQLGLVEGLLVHLVEVAPHRPLAGDLDLGAGRDVEGRRRSSPSSPAATGRSASSPISCSTGMRAVVPSWEIIPASGGMAVGSTTDDDLRSALELGDDCGQRRSGPRAIGVSWW